MTQRLVLEVGGVTFAAPLDAEPQMVTTVDENAAAALHVDPAEEDVAYRLMLGSEPAETEDGDGLAVHSGGRAHWRAAPYFESARGPTQLRVESSAGDGAWRTRGGMLVDIVPAKLGEAQYRALFDELRTVSTSLVYDVRGKSGRGGGPAAETIIDAWARVERVLRRSSAPGIVRGVRGVHGTGARTASRTEWIGTAAAMAGAGSVRRSGQATRPGTRHRRALALAAALDPAQRTDTRRIATLLDRISRELVRVRSQVDGAADEIRHGRERVSTRVHGRTIFELVDEPRLRRLDQLSVAATTVLDRAAALRATEPFARAQPLPRGAAGHAHAGPRPTGERALRQTLAAVRAASAGGQYVRPTSRLYETWVFLRVARAVAAAAVSDQPLDALVRSIRQRGLGAVLTRGTTLEFTLYDRRTVRLVSEPAIRNRAQAVAAGDTLFRLQDGAPPLMPDLLLTVQSPAGLRTVIIDAKYARAMRPAIWNGLERYFEIRPLASPRAVPQVWVTAPIPTRPDASALPSGTVPGAWRGGLLPLVPGSVVPHAYQAGAGAPHTFTLEQGGAGSRGRSIAATHDGTAIALRAFVAELLYGAAP